jgi:hypothetical protein
MDDTKGFQHGFVKSQGYPSHTDPRAFKVCSLGDSNQGNINFKSLGNIPNVFFKVFNKFNYVPKMLPQIRYTS